MEDVENETEAFSTEEDPAQVVMLSENGEEVFGQATSLNPNIWYCLILLQNISFKKQNICKETVAKTNKPTKK